MRAIRSEHFDAYSEAIELQSPREFVYRNFSIKNEFGDYDEFFLPLSKTLVDNCMIIVNPDLLYTSCFWICIE